MILQSQEAGLTSGLEVFCSTLARRIWAGIKTLYEKNREIGTGPKSLFDSESLILTREILLLQRLSDLILRLFGTSICLMRGEVQHPSQTWKEPGSCLLTGIPAGAWRSSASSIDPRSGGGVCTVLAGTNNYFVLRGAKSLIHFRDEQSLLHENQFLHLVSVRLAEVRRKIW